MRIYSRNGYDWSKQLPAIADALQALPVASVMLDGEVVGVTRITFLYPAAR